MSRLKRNAEMAVSAFEENPCKKPKQSELNHDPVLTQLFASSLGPTKAFSKTFSHSAVSKAVVPRRSSENGYGAGFPTRELAAELASAEGSAHEKRQDRKRKRRDTSDDVEGRYLRQLAFEETRDSEKLASTTQDSQLAPDKPVKLAQDGVIVSPAKNPKSGAINLQTDEDDESVGGGPLQHEIVAPLETDVELEKSSRTVFLANVSTSTIKSKTAKKIFLDHLASFIPTLPTSNVPHAVESLRFRSTAFSNTGIPRRAAFVKKELMETTTRSTNAYAVYTTQVAAREAMKKLNGTIVLDRHLRVDSVAHPAKQDHRRCVFVGNLGFVDDTTAINAAEDNASNSKPRKGKEPADVEEGLWRQFGKIGGVESVRVVRDKTTRIGKGFAYVQFWDANAVEKALLLNEKKFPPMLPRILRVTRAKNVTKPKYPRDDRGKRSVKKPGAWKGLKKETKKPPTEVLSLASRANRLFGRADAAKINKEQGKRKKAKKPTKSSNKRAERFKNKAKQQDT